MDRTQFGSREGATGQDLAAFEGVISRSYGALIRFASRRLPDRASAEDAVAETYAAAWKKWCRGQAVVTTWLYRVLVHKIADHYRAQERAVRVRNDVGSKMLRDAVGCDHLDVLALHGAIAKLEEREQRSIHLTYWVGLTAAEMAHVLDVTEAYAWTILSRARRKLLAEIRSL